MRQNVGLVDRTIRILGGLTLMTIGTHRLLKRKRGLVISLLGFSLFSEGIFGYCLGYDLMGISTKDRPLYLATVQPKTVPLLSWCGRK
ncbi:MAG: YgaP family membrane protein [bacterium]|jgi:hypothetical protein